MKRDLSTLPYHSYEKYQNLLKAIRKNKKMKPSSKKKAIKTIKHNMKYLEH